MGSMLPSIYIYMYIYIACMDPMGIVMSPRSSSSAACKASLRWSRPLWRACLKSGTWGCLKSAMGEHLYLLFNMAMECGPSIDNIIYNIVIYIYNLMICPWKMIIYTHLPITRGYLVNGGMNVHLTAILTCFSNLETRVTGSWVIDMSQEYYWNSFWLGNYCKPFQKWLILLMHIMIYITWPTEECGKHWETHTPKIFGDDGYDNMRFNTQQMDPNGHMR